MGRRACCAKEGVKRGAWTSKEDDILASYIKAHGEGRWREVPQRAGLRRCGKSCRLRWLNYLRPDVKRGNFTADEQLLILDLHSRWGNRWSKIAQHLPGRTDNEIKNYWRTRVQKHAKQLNCDANSNKFKDAMRYLWMPRLAVDRQLQQAAAVCDHVVPGLAMGYMESSGMVTSSSDSFATSGSYDERFYTNVHPGEMIDGGDWMQQTNQVLCFESTQPNQFQDSELTGWVQGFSEGLPENYWSLEDIWKMQ